MKRMSERIELAKIVLTELSRQKLCRTALESKTTKKAGTHATFESIFNFLVEREYIAKEKPQEHRSSYMITTKGSKFLEGI